MDNRKLNYFYEKKANRLDLLWWYWFYLINGNSAVCTGTTTIHIFSSLFLQWNQKGIGWFGPKCAFMDVRYDKKKSENVVWNTHAPKASMYKICISYVLGIHFFSISCFLSLTICHSFSTVLLVFGSFFSDIYRPTLRASM